MTEDRILGDSLSGDDRVLRALADDERRQVLEALEDTDAPVAVSDLAVELTRRETGDGHDRDSVFDRARQRRIGLHHCHLPKLAEAGLITYDASERLVARRDTPGIEGPSERLKPQTP